MLKVHNVYLSVNIKKQLTLSTEYEEKTSLDIVTKTRDQLIWLFH